MSDLNLNRLARPKTLNDFVGTQLVKDKINTLLRRNNKPKFIIISGSSGLGKTSLARLIIKQYKCEKSAGLTCDMQGLELENQCPTCKLMNHYIETGSTDDLPTTTEVDVGKYSRISDLRELLDELDTQSVGYSGLKAVILDEVQSLGYKAQDALLKMLEEPEENVIFIMCTTNIDKIQPTVVNRAEVDLKLQPPAVKTLTKRFKEICEQERIPYSQLGLELIATRYSDRIRMAVQVIENIKYQYGTVDEINVKKYLETDSIPAEDYFKFISGVVNKEDKTKAMVVLHQVKVNSDFDTFSNELINFVRRAIYIRSGLPVEGVLESEIKAYAKLLEPMTIKQLSTLLDYLQTIKRGDIEINLMTLVYSSLESKEEHAIKKLYTTMLNNERHMEEEVREANVEIQKEIGKAKTKEVEDQFEKPLSAEDIMKNLMG